MDMGMPLGIDVSNWQGNVDWEAVKANGVVFGFCKATEGIDYRDRFFPHNWQQMKASGIYRGAYHFSRPSRGTQADKEAYYFIDYINENGGFEAGDIGINDMEDPNFTGSASAWTLFWMQAFESAAGFKPV